MIHSIDYYSFTIPHEFPQIMSIQEKNRECVKTFLSVCDLEPMLGFKLEDWTPEIGLRQYQVRLRHASLDICLSFGSVNAHIFVECAGKACNNLDALDALEQVIAATHERATRIDFAVDIECDTDPSEFTAFRKNKSFKSSGEIRSPSGRTSYVGGRASDRMARVYRYEPPHPRARFLRVEAEFKHAAAKAAAGRVGTQTLAALSLDAHSSFQWSHPAWTPENINTSKIAYKVYRPENAATVRWLYGDVVTALSKAIKAELIDFDEWLNFVREGLF